MSIYYDTFKNKIQSLWAKAITLDKPIHKDITWTCGVVKGRADFNDLQLHGLALATSIIIKEPVVPKIIIGWDTYLSTNDFLVNSKLKETHYPNLLLSSFDDPGLLHERYRYVPEFFQRSNKYVELRRHPFSISAHPYGLGHGYRVKYHGLEYVTTPYGIMTDIDTVCTKPCLEYLQSVINIKPDTFCLTNKIGEKWASVGLCVFNMLKYNMIYKPHWYKMAWETHRADSTFIPSVLEKFPEVRDQLDVRLFDGTMINAEKFFTCPQRGNIWNDEKTAHYHAWKGEIDSNPSGFVDFYNKIIDDLEADLNQQLIK
jgi:hypothetical protein